MAYVDFVTRLHKATTRDYLGRVNAHDKAACAEIALRWDRDYWDGERHLGYGGYRYDGRWRPVAEAMVRHYQLAEDARILDVGCGKGFLLYEFTQVLPRATVAGIDISRYALEHAKEEVRPHLVPGTAAQLPWEDHSFDLVYLHQYAAQPVQLRTLVGDSGNRTRRPAGQAHHRRIVSQRTREGEPAVLAVDLPCVPGDARVGVAVRARGLHGRLGVHFLRVRRRWQKS